LRAGKPRTFLEGSRVAKDYRTSRVALRWVARLSLFRDIDGGGFMIKDGEHELDYKVLCPRCAATVPVYLRKILDRFETRVEIHCLKCKCHRNEAGTYIGELQKGA